MSDLAVGEHLPDSRARNRCLLVLFAVAGGCTAWILLPMVAALFLGAVGAVVFEPVYRRLLGWWRGHAMLAATAVTLAVVVAIGVPIALLTVLTAREVADGAVTVARIADEEGVEGLVDRLPRSLRSPARRVVAWAELSEPAAANGAAPSEGGGEAATGTDGAAEPAEPAPPAEPARPRWMEGLAGRVATFGAGVTERVLALLIDGVLAVVAMFCFLAWGQALVRWIRSVVPLPNAQSDRLVAELRDVTRGVVVATFVAAVGQTIVAAIGYAIAGVGSLPFAVMVTLAAGVIPAVGGALVTCAIGVLQMLQGEVGWGVFLFAWGVTAVNITESVLAPWLSAGRVRIHGALVLFAMLGGIAMFGPLGIVAGPLTVAFFRTVVEIAREPVPLPVLTQPANPLGS